MSILKRLKKKKSDPWHGLKDEHRVIEAFEFEGVQYYQFEDIFNSCSGRAFSALDFYEELNMRTTREFLMAHCDVTKKFIDKAKKGMLITNDVLDFNNVNTPLLEIEKLNNQLEQRLDMIVDHDAIYKLASVVFFTKEEKPYDFDYKYNLEQKIPAFKRMDDSFFLLMRTCDLLPSGDLSDIDFKTYLDTQKKINDHMLENLLSQSSEDFKKTEYYKRLGLLMNTALSGLNSRE